MKQILIPLFLGAAVFQGLAQSCVATASLTVTINNNCTKLAPKAFLQGPYVAANTAMSDNLRTNNLIPTTSPYAADAATADASVVQNPTITALNANANAIVDWVLVELRDKTTPTTVLGSAAALIQRDGDIVAVDGASPVVLNVPVGNDYYVAVKHRNHLGVMTGTAVTATAGATAVVDFTTMVGGEETGTNKSWGTRAQRNVGGKYCMYAGNIKYTPPSNGISTNVLKYTGASNDRSLILTAINIAHSGIIDLTATSPNVYAMEDVNMNGEIKYTGGSNDRAIILANITNYNGDTDITKTVPEQLPN
jgi:hypothetical protein